MNIQLSDHFSFKKLLTFTGPSIIMMIFTSIYSVVDGFFISNFVGITEFAAINLIMPFTQILGCIGFMFGAGGSALVSKTLGEKNDEKANRIFSMLVYIGICTGIVLSILGIIFIEPIARLLGADSVMLPHCVTYGRVLLCTLPFFMLQNMFQSFLITAERPSVGLAVTVGAGVTNMVLDALFIIVFKWSIVGAAAATAIAQIVGGIIPFIYFISGNNVRIHLCRTQFDIRAILSTCANGSSELVSNISMSIVSILYNFQLMKFAGSNGVAAYGAVMYVSFIFIAIFIGYSIGVAPVIGFHYGASNSDELKNLFKKSCTIIGSCAAVLFAIAFILSKPLAIFFLGSNTAVENPELIDMTVNAFKYFAISVLFSGFSIFGSAFFTALNDGAVSAAISFMRMLVFQIITVLILPIFFEINGIWYSFFTAEILSLAVTLFFLIKMRKKYNY